VGEDVLFDVVVDAVDHPDAYLTLFWEDDVVAPLYPGRGGIFSSMAAWMSPICILISSMPGMVW
jgi:hypothetical protein